MGEHLVKHCFSNSASGKNIRVGNTKITRKAMVNTYNGEGNLISQQEVIDEGALIPRGRREELGLRMIWGRVLSSMPEMPQSVGKLPGATQNKGMFRRSSSHLR